MASKKKRQTMEKFQREQAVRRKREDKAQKKEGRRLAKAAGFIDGVEGADGVVDADGAAVQVDPDAVAEESEPGALPEAV